MRHPLGARRKQNATPAAVERARTFHPTRSVQKPAAHLSDSDRAGRSKRKRTSLSLSSATMVRPPSLLPLLLGLLATAHARALAIAPDPRAALSPGARARARASCPLAPLFCPRRALLPTALVAVAVAGLPHCLFLLHTPKNTNTNNRGTLTCWRTTPRSSWGGERANRERERGRAPRPPARPCLRPPGPKKAASRAPTTHHLQTNTTTTPTNTNKHQQTNRAYVLFLTWRTVLEGKGGSPQVWAATELPLKIAQSAAVMEVVHAATGIVRSPVGVTGKEQNREAGGERE